MRGPLGSRDYLGAGAGGCKLAAAGTVTGPLCYGRMTHNCLRPDGPSGFDRNFGARAVREVRDDGQRPAQPLHIALERPELDARQVVLDARDLSLLEAGPVGEIGLGDVEGAP